MRSVKKGQAKDIGRIPVERSSGNVFEDLGVPESAEMLAKAELAERIAEIISERRLTQAGAAKVLGIPAERLRSRPGASARVLLRPALSLPERSWA